MNKVQIQARPVYVYRSDTPGYGSWDDIDESDIVKFLSWREKSAVTDRTVTYEVRRRTVGEWEPIDAGEVL